MRDLTRTLLVLATVTTLGLLAASALPGPARAPALSASVLGPHGVLASTKLNSTNWAGYGTTSANYKITKVTGTWVEPAVTCTATTSLAAFWVGIDGLGYGVTSNTVEQTGTIAECVGGTASYYAWWELYPTNAIQVFAAVSAGDHFSAEVLYHSATKLYQMQIVDTTTHTVYSTNGTQTASRNTAECVAEAPSGSSGVYPLAHFGHMTFTTCTATVSGHHGGIGTFTPLYAIDMTNSAGTKYIATVGALTSNTKFTVTHH
jgi:hypothetical protein